MIDVVWLTYDPKSIPRGYWDQAVLEELFAGGLWPLRGRPSVTHHHGLGTVPAGHGAVVVLPGRFHASLVATLAADLMALPWVLVVVSSDEERLFDVDALAQLTPDLPLGLWIQTPREGMDQLLGFGFGVGYSPGTHDAARRHASDIEAKPDPWFFSGQMTHPRRREAGGALQKLDDAAPGRHFYATPGFTQGMPKEEYFGRLARAMVAPCPSGPETPDSFRSWEALELGAYPLLDAATPYGPDDYWQRVGWPDTDTLINDWREAPAHIETLTAEFPRPNTRALAWHLGRKRAMAQRLVDDVLQVSREHPGRSDVDDLVTVIMPTSPIPSHPRTELIEETIDTVRTHLPRAEIIITADGGEGAVRSSDQYAEYLWRLVRLCHLDYTGVLPLLMTERLHQTGMLRKALEHVRTPLVLYVEHDTPLTTDRPINWAGCARAILSGEVNAIRFHHEEHVLDVHQHLMVDRDPMRMSGTDLLRCAQWSQRPHLASTEYYRRISAEHLRQPGRFIEDIMHSVLDCAWRDEGFAGWDRHRLAMYAPEGDIKRSYHLDGRRA